MSGEQSVAVKTLSKAVYSLSFFLQFVLFVSNLFLHLSTDLIGSDGGERCAEDMAKDLKSERCISTQLDQRSSQTQSGHTAQRQTSNSKEIAI